MTWRHRRVRRSDGSCTPRLDETDRHQFRGCLEGWAIDHVRLDVVSLESSAEGRPGGGAHPGGVMRCVAARGIVAP
jgi:hypothetical protein